jgi:hypothetical protein
MKDIGAPPEKGTAQWKRNESIIAKNPLLRSLREKSEGFAGKSSSAGNWTPTQAYKDNYDAIFGKRDKKDE